MFLRHAVMGVALLWTVHLAANLCAQTQSQTASADFGPTVESNGVVAPNEFQHFVAHKILHRDQSPLAGPPSEVALTQPTTESQPTPAAAASSSVRVPLFSSDASQSAASSGSPTGSNLSSTSTGSWLLQTITALGVVIGLIFVVRFIYLKISGQTPVRSANRLVEVLSRSAIAPRHQVVLLRLGRRILVVGETQSGMNTLANIDDPQEVAALLGAVEAEKPNSVSRQFTEALGRFTCDYNADEAPSFDQEPTDPIQGVEIPGAGNPGLGNPGVGTPGEDRINGQLAGLLSRVRAAAIE